MNVVFIVTCFLSSLMITLSRGAGPAFALVYLPSLLLFAKTPALFLPGLPDANPPAAAIYGILLGGLLAGRRPRLRATAVDYVVVLLLCTYALSAFMTAHSWRAVSVTGSMAFSYGFLPYFVARIAYQRRAPPRQALALLVATTLVICVFALIEFRLWPAAYGNLLSSLGLHEPPGQFMLRRLGRFRALVSFGHPIDLGISAGLVFAMIAMFAWRLRIALKTIWVLAGFAAALIACFCAISFSAFMGLGCGMLLYLILIRFPHARRLLPAAVVLIMLGGIALTAYLAALPYERAARYAGREEGALSTSFLNRQEVIQLSFETAKTSGFFGYGDTLPEEIDRSVDNAYLLIAMRRGWAALGLWLALPVLLAALASRGVRRARERRQVQIILAGFSAVVGTMISMYTVWFGFLYPSFFMIVLALTVNESQAAIHAARPHEKRAVAARAIPAAP
jgi:hypothetical protein